MTTPILPDILEENLLVVFCGTAASTVSAQKQSYYAGPGNKFWDILHHTGLTPYRLQPAEYPTVTRYRIGLTDVAPYSVGADSGLRKADFAADAVRANIRRYAPRILAFNGKRAAQETLQHPVAYGRIASSTQNATDPRDAWDTTILYVLPSTSGLAVRFWNPQHWHDLAALVATLR